MKSDSIQFGSIKLLRSTLLVLWLVLTCNALWAQTSTRAFDHVKTGFALTGSHTKQRCESCHINGTFKGTPRDCASCHVGSSRLAVANIVKPQTHFPTQLTCDNCHNSLTFTGAKFNHMGIAPNSCGTCHNGMTATGKPSGHIMTAAACSTCHRTSGWLPATGMDHSQFTVATNCSSCHNGSSATGKTVNHIPTVVNCISCHATTGWKPTKWNHTQMPVTNACSTCHSGAYPPADGRPGNHIPYQILAGVAIPNCDSCHKAGYASWFPGKFHSNVSVSTQCATCHLNSIYGVTPKPSTPTHALVTGSCENCHKTSNSWVSSKPDHSLFTVATTCGTCHDGTTALGKPNNHMPTALNCIACHSATSSVFSPNTWNHTQQVVTNQCSTCHTGALLTGLGKPGNHIPYQVLSGVAIPNCDTCHKAGFVTWNPGLFHRNVTISTQCATCHLTSIYGLTAKPATQTHALITGNCESCHSNPNAAWSSATFAHSPANAVGTGTCDTCHGVPGATPPNAKGKPATHIPVLAGLAKCDSCHSSQSTFTIFKMNHSVVTTATCKSCHNGSYTTQGTLGAYAKPVNHIPEVQLLNGANMDCNACHSNTTSFLTEKMNHNGSLGAGAGQCTGCHLNSSSYLGTQQKNSLTHQSSGQIDCSTSKCHAPLGTKGTSFVKWK